MHNWSAPLMFWHSVVRAFLKFGMRAVISDAVVLYNVKWFRRLPYLL